MNKYFIVVGVFVFSTLYAADAAKEGFNVGEYVKVIAQEETTAADKVSKARALLGCFSKTDIQHPLPVLRFGLSNVEHHLGRHPSDDAGPKSAAVLLEQIKEFAGKQVIK